ncbi:MAG TPA: hypothetical protein VFN31_02525 [Candidatus Saccharimonadales bacterium]|nr:hypothetical protein [Candidatus Saccharimonadales bacterium]
MESDITPRREDHYKDDIKPRGADGFDSRDSRVRMHSIGWLDDNYLSKRSILQPKYASDEFTRIPPLSDLSVNPAKQGLVDALKPRLKYLRRTLPVLIASAVGWILLRLRTFRKTLLKSLPTNYSEKRGLYVDWPSVRESLLKRGAPFALLGCLAIGILFLASGTPTKIQTHRQHHATSNILSSRGGKNTAQANKPNTPSAGNNQNSTNKSVPPTTATNSSSSNSASLGSSSSTSSPGYYLGPSSSSGSSPTYSPGYGGGGAYSPQTSTATSTTPTTSSSSPTSTTSGSSGTGSTSTGGTGSSSLLPLTVTSPPVNSSLGGKTLLNTSPTTVTVN